MLFLHLVVLLNNSAVVIGSGTSDETLLKAVFLHGIRCRVSVGGVTVSLQKSILRRNESLEWPKCCFPYLCPSQVETCVAGG